MLARSWACSAIDCGRSWPILRMAKKGRISKSTSPFRAGQSLMEKDDRKMVGFLKWSSRCSRRKVQTLDRWPVAFENGAPRGCEKESKGLPGRIMERPGISSTIYKQGVFHFHDDFREHVLVHRFGVLDSATEPI